MIRTQPGTDLGQLLLRARLQHYPPMSQEAVAAGAGVNARTYGGWERQELTSHTVIPQWDQLDRVADFLGLDRAGVRRCCEEMRIARRAAKLMKSQ